MAPGEWPARVVQRIPGSGTSFYGDTLIDSNGNRWRTLSEAEANYYGNNGGTAIAVLARIYPDGTIR